MGRAKTRNNLDKKQAEMKVRMLRERYLRDPDLKVPKGFCPMCLSSHEDAVPDVCWKKAALGDVSDFTAFERYLKTNKKGRFI